MKILAQWDAADSQGSNPMVEVLVAQLAPLAEINPPDPALFDRTLEKRKQYIAEHIRREHLTEALRRSHLRRHAPTATLANIQRLRETNAFLVITGQQPGILGGPLFTFYKILHAIILAERLTQAGTATYIPAFWNASEDHDFPEIAELWWLSKENQPVSFTWPGDPQSRRPYYHIPAREFPLDDLINYLRAHSMPTEFLEPYLSAIGDWRNGAESYPDMVDAAVWSLFPEEGLLILRPDDPFVRENARKIMEAEIDDPGSSAREVAKAGERLRSLGLEAQIHKREDRTAFFLVEKDQRIPLYVTGDGFEVPAGKRYSKDDLRERLERNPESFSPSAILRPVVQDALFPTAVAVLGPNELSYHFLLSGIYAKHGVPRPSLMPRLGFTLVEPRAMRLMEKYQLTPAALLRDPQALLKDLLRKQKNVEVASLRPDAGKSVRDYFATLLSAARDIDPTIIPVLEKNQAKILREMENSESLLIRREAEKNETLRAHLLSLQNAFFPGGELQERRLNVFYYLMKYGPEFLAGIKQLGKSPGIPSHSFVLIP